MPELPFEDATVTINYQERHTPLAPLLSTCTAHLNLNTTPSTSNMQDTFQEDNVKAGEDIQCIHSLFWGKKIVIFQLLERINYLVFWITFIPSSLSFYTFYLLSLFGYNLYRVSKWLRNKYHQYVHSSVFHRYNFSPI